MPRETWSHAPEVADKKLMHAVRREIDAIIAD